MKYPMGLSQKATIVWLSGLFVLLLAVYAPFIGNPIFFDDSYFFLDKIGSLTSFKENWNIFETRWLPYKMLAVEQMIFGDYVYHYRIISMLLHLAVSVAFGMVVFEILKKLYDYKIAQRFAFLLSAIFIVHPLLTYATGYIIQRSVLMSMGFALLSTWAFLQWNISQYKMKKWMWWSVGLFLLAAQSKESVVLLPVVFFIFHIALTDTKMRSMDFWKPMLVSMPWYALVVAYLVFEKFYLIATQYEVGAGFLSDGLPTDYLYLSSVLTQAELFFKYFFLWWAPMPSSLSIDIRENMILAEEWTSWIGLSGWIVYIFFTSFMLIKFRRTPLSIVGAALLIPALLFGTEFSTIRIQEPFVLYRTYFWMPWTLLILPIFMYRLRMKMIWIIGGSLIISYAMIALMQLKGMSSPFSLWDNAITLNEKRKVDTGLDRAYYNRGLIYLNHGDAKKALEDFTTAVQLVPSNPHYYFSYANALFILGEYEKSEIALKNVIVNLNSGTQKVEQWRILLLTAYIYTKTNRFAQAEPLIEWGCPNYPSFCNLKIK